MLLQKIVHLTEEEVHKIMQKYIEKKIKGTVELVQKNTENGLSFHITKTSLEESGE